MSDKELFVWGFIAFMVLMVGVVFTVVEFNRLGKSLQNNTERNS